MSELYATCQVCGRSIMVEHGRYTVHTNPALAEGRWLPRCEMAGKPFPPDTPAYRRPR